MLNRWIKPNEDLDIIISRHVMKKYELQPWSTEVVVHSFMMYADGSVEFNAEMRYTDWGGFQRVEFQRGFL
ncbi:hypothetical protein PM136_00070 [Escherichia phage vB_EcoM-PM136]|nr:hypothetical protein PM136_00070 [Escherichia phage vB_EcoM-PM136]